MSTQPQFQAPTLLDRVFNAAVGWLVARGIGPAHMRVLEVRGRKSGRLYRMPVDPLPVEGRLYLVAPRGRTQWVRNAEAAGEVVLRRGGAAERHRLRAVPPPDRPPLLQAYLDRYRREVQRFFPVPAGSPASAFEPWAERYPVFELERLP